MAREVANSLFDIDSSIIALAHELKSPLALMRQLSLSLSDDTVSTKDIQTISSQLNLTSERALRLVSDLTKTARLEDAMFEMSPVNPRKICDEVVSIVNTNRQSTLATRYSSKPQLVVANRSLLESIIYNFCDNAFHYSDSTATSSLFIRSIPNSKIRIGVRDFGPCLPLKLWRDIKKTGRVPSPQTIQARPQSSGLGLYVASRFAEAMHGQLGVIHHRDGVTLYVDLHTSNQLSLL